MGPFLEYKMDSNENFSCHSVISRFKCTKYQFLSDQCRVPLSKNHIKQCYFGRVMLQVYLYTEMSKRFKVNLYEISAIHNIQQAGNHLDPITVVLRLSFCLQKQSKLTEVFASALLLKRCQGSNSLRLEKLHLKRFGSLMSFCQRTEKLHLKRVSGIIFF